MTKPERKQLRRIPDQGKIAGVCAGVAEYTGTEAWLVRIIWFSGLLLSGGFFFIAYVAGWFILDKKPSDNLTKLKGGNQHTWKGFDHDIDQSVEVKTKVWQAGEPPRQAYRDIVRQFDNIEKRVRDMEGYVTSNEYTLTHEINKI